MTTWPPTFEQEVERAKLAFQKFHVEDGSQPPPTAVLLSDTGAEIVAILDLDDAVKRSAAVCDMIHGLRATRALFTADTWVARYEPGEDLVRPSESPKRTEALMVVTATAEEAHIGMLPYSIAGGVVFFGTLSELKGQAEGIHLDMQQALARVADARGTA